MTIKLVDQSDIKQPTKKIPIQIIDKDDVFEKEGKDKISESTEKREVVGSTEAQKGFEFISKDNIVECERAVKIGLTDNCALCQAANNEIFKKCPNKWK